MTAPAIERSPANVNGLLGVRLRHTRERCPSRSSPCCRPFVVSSPWTARSKLATSARPIEATARAPKARDDVLAHRPCELIPGADLGCVRPHEALGGIRNDDAAAARIAHLGACPACLSERRGGIAADDGTCDIRPPQPCLPAGRADAKDQAGGSRVDDVPPPGRGELDGADRCVRKGALVESLLCHCALCRFSVPMRQTLHLVEGRARPYKNGCFPRFLQRFVDRGVAQSGRASALGAEGRWFEIQSPRPTLSMQRTKLISFLTTLPPATVAMEACVGRASRRRCWARETLPRRPD